MRSNRPDRLRSGNYLNQTSTRRSVFPTSAQTLSDTLVVGNRMKLMRVCVLVRREMECGRSLLVSLGASRGGPKGAANRKADGTRKQGGTCSCLQKEDQAGHSSAPGSRDTEHRCAPSVPWVSRQTLMLKAKANWLGKKNLGSRVRGAFQLSNRMMRRHGVDQMASGQVAHQLLACRS